MMRRQILVHRQRLEIKVFVRVKLVNLERRSA